MGITKNYRLPAAALVAVLCTNAYAENVVALGPIEKVSVDGTVVQVLGQAFTIRSSSIADGKGQLANAPANLSVGTYLYVEGERSADGTLIAFAVQPSERPYVPGASEIFLSGVVSKFDEALGIATIGNTQIYVPDASVEIGAPILEGTSISVVGYQAVPRQQIWATEIQNEVSISIQGTGANSLSIQGTGKQSIQGTGVNSLSIQGTGKQSIQGTGVNSLSIQGTG